LASPLMPPPCWNLGQGPRPPRPTPRTIFAQVSRAAQILNPPACPGRFHRLQDRKPLIRFISPYYGSKSEPARFLTSAARQNGQAPKLFEGRREPDSALAQGAIKSFSRWSAQFSRSTHPLSHRESSLDREVQNRFPPK
jgi:hypothetical protein